MMASLIVLVAWPLLILIVKTEPDFHVFAINEVSLDEDGSMKDMLFFLLAITIAGLLMGLERGIEIACGAPLRHCLFKNQRHCSYSDQASLPWQAMAVENTN